MINVELTWNLKEYLAYSFCLMLVFTALYHLIFRRLTFFTVNRFYLILSLAVSLSFPLIHVMLQVPTPLRLTPTMKLDRIVEDTDQLILNSYSSFTVKASKQNLETRHLIENIVLGVYVAISATLLIRLLLMVFTLLSQARSGIRKDGFVWIKPGGSYKNSSFFNLLFIDPLLLPKEQLAQVLQHENLHRIKFHSADKLFIEIIQVFLWFNPLVYYYKVAIALNHEFEVDQAVCKTLNKIEYSNVLVSLCSATPFSVVNNFSNQPIHSRIRFIFKRPTAQIGRFSYALVVPSILLLFFIFSVHQSEAFYNKRTGSDLPVKILQLVNPKQVFSTPKRKAVRDNEKPIAAPSKPLVNSSILQSEPFIIILDPGHGGEDNAAGVQNIYEKDLVLDISSTLKSALEAAGFQVLMTRDEDRFVALSNRVKYKGDAFISIHANTALKANEVAGSGMEIIIPNKARLKDSTLLDKSLILAESVKLGLSGMEIPMREDFKDVGLFVLSNNLSPSILLELGYMNNEKDFRSLTDKIYQKKLADQLVVALKDYQSKL